MLYKWLLLAAFFGTLNATITCDPSLGRAIRAGDCGWALEIFKSRLMLSDPRNSAFQNAQRTFIHHSGNPQNSMPQGVSFGNCGIGVDIAPATHATSSWAEVALRLQNLINACSTQSLGGTNVFGQFTALIVDSGQGMRNLAGTCMSPNPSFVLPLHWQMKERLCGFQHLTPNLPPPDTSQLPAPPTLLPMSLTITTHNWPPFKARGQWIWNANVWSPILGNGLTQPLGRTVWILLTGGGPQPNSNTHLRPFSRTVPRIMGAAWIQQQNGGPPLRIRGAWGARAYNWVPLTGSLASVQLYINNFDWVLVETGIPDQAGGTTTPAGQAPIPVPGQGQSSRPPLSGQVRAPAPGLRQAPIPLLGMGSAARLPLPGQVRAPRPGSGQARPPAVLGLLGPSLQGLLNRTGPSLIVSTSLDPAQATESAEGSRQTAEAAGVAPETAEEVGQNPSGSTITDDADGSNRDDATRSLTGGSDGWNQPARSGNNPAAPLLAPVALSLPPSMGSPLPSPQSSGLSEASTVREGNGARPSKRPHLSYEGTGR